MRAATASGLDGVVVAETLLSDVDGEAGRLVLCGQDVERFAAHATFEDAVALFLPGASSAALGRARAAAYARIPSLGDALHRVDGMDALRAALSHGTITDDGLQDGVALIGAAGTYLAAWDRLRRGDAPVAPDPARGHADDVLRMLRGAPAAPAEVRALDAYLVTVVDHGMNASTFAARVAASTGTDLVSAVVAGIATLKGPLHGGAPGPVLAMLDEIAAPERAAPWLLARLARGERIMGMGHRIYRVRDPRALVLEHALERLEQAGRGGARLALARSVEKAAERLLAERKPDRRLKANVEFYTAVLLDAVGVDPRAMSPMFAASRVVGWVAHVFEQRRAGRLIRPASRYVGPPTVVDVDVHATTSATVPDHPPTGG